MQSLISLSRLVQLRVPVTWQEAVAVAQCVAAALENATPLGGDNCLLAADGFLEISGASAEPWPKPALGALRLLLDPNRSPAELVSLVKKADAMSDAEISENLRFFARPDIQTVISTLAARAIQADTDADAQRAFETLRAEAASGDNPKKPADADVKRRLSRRAVAVAIASVAVAVVVSLVVVASQRSDANPEETIVNDMAATTTLAVQNLATKVDSLVDSGLKSLGLTPTAAAEPPSSAPAPAPPKPVQKPSVKRKADRPTVAVLPSPPAVIGAETAQPVLPLDRPLLSEPVEPDATVYTQSDEAVAPPTLVRPQLPTPTGAEAGAATHLVLHVNADGTVDRVRLHPEGSTLNDRMLVSAAKAWVFRPAVKDGHPVRYALLVPLTR